MLVLFGVLIVACSSDGDDAGNDGDGAEATEPADDGGDATEPADEGDGGGGSGATELGSATVTIGDESWSFSVNCAFTREETRSDRVSFSLSGSGETAEGVSIQLNASIQDERDDGRYEGDGVTYKASVADAEDFENPSVRWLSLLFPMEGNSLLQVDGKNVTADMTFRDYVSGAVDEIPGTLEATCP